MGGRRSTTSRPFNEPRLERRRGRWICFGEDLGSDGEWRVWDHWVHQGVRDTGRRWDNAVRSVLADENVGGLIDVCRSVNGPDAVACTHVVGGRQRFFDHILVSPHFRVLDMGFEHAWRAQHRCADHSAVWADLEFS